MPDTEPGKQSSTKLNRIAQIARENRTVKFTSLAHLLDKESLESAYKELVLEDKIVQKRDILIMHINIPFNNPI